jgi:hypothetical protein
MDNYGSDAQGFWCVLESSESEHLMMMMFIGTDTLVTQLENERSRVHATEVAATYFGHFG